MAWITKNSGTVEIDRRDSPYLTPEMRASLEADILPRYPTRQAATLPVLHELQHEHGWLPHQALIEAAAFLELPAATVLDTATFYEEFFLHPVGRYVVWVCQSIACELMGHMKLLDALEAKLGVGVGETTPDGKFTLMVVECIGACGGAPAALVSHKLHENLTVDNLDRILDSLE